MAEVKTRDHAVDYNKMMKNLPSNSKEGAQQPTEERKRLQKVTKATVKPKKKTWFQKFKDAWLPEPGMELSDYVIGDILVPGLKNILSGVVTNSVEMALFGEVRSSRRGGRDDRYVPYNRYYDDRDRVRSSRAPRASYTSRSALNFDSDIFESRADAIAVLDELIQHIDDYGFASIGDYCDLIEKTCDFTDWKYGWTNLNNVKIFQERGGYSIDFPRPVYMA